MLGNGGRVNNGINDDEENDDSRGNGSGRARLKYCKNSAVSNNPNLVPESIEGDNSESMSYMLTKPPELQST